MGPRHQTFATEAAAAYEAELYRGWKNPRATQVHLLGDPNADDAGNVWIVVVGDGTQSLRVDGHVR